MLSPLLLPLSAPGSVMTLSGIPPMISLPEPVESSIVPVTDHEFLFELSPRLPDAPTSPQPSFRPCGPSHDGEFEATTGPACRAKHERHSTWLWQHFVDRRQGMRPVWGPETHTDITTSVQCAMQHGVRE